MFFPSPSIPGYCCSVSSALWLALPQEEWTYAWQPNWELGHEVRGQVSKQITDPYVPRALFLAALAWPAVDLTGTKVPGTRVLGWDPEPCCGGKEYPGSG